MGWGTSAWGITLFGTGTSGPGGLLISNVDPVSNSVIDKSRPITFDLTSPSSTIQVVIAAEYADSGIVELVYDNSVLTPYYRNGSASVSAITNGFHFSLLRTPSWPGALVRIRVLATDSSGNMLIATMGWTVQTTEVVATPAGLTTISERTQFDPLGFGMLRPFVRTSASDFAATSGEALVRATVGQILGTALGEIPWRPDFGTTLSRLRHMRNTDQLPELARLSIQEALQRWEPRVTISDISAEPVSTGTENKVLLSISYRVGNSNPTSVKVLI